MIYPLAKFLLSHENERAEGGRLYNLNVLSG